MIARSLFGTRGRLHSLGRRLFYTVYGHPLVVRFLVRHFHRMFFHVPDSARVWRNAHWLGTRALKCPFDLWVYQEIIHAERPDFIVETGTASGGSALYLASICDLVGNGQVITIDVAPRDGRPVHPRIRYLTGSSTAPEIFGEVERAVARSRRTLVILDSDHRKDHVLEELRLYSRLVTPGSYLIVEDTNLNGHPVGVLYGPGPMEAVGEFLRANPAFQTDRACEKFFLTFNPGGYLKRTA